jgi:phosphate/sulfate permease
MGLILLALIGFLPAYYAMDLTQPRLAVEVHDAAISMKEILQKNQIEDKKLLEQLDEIQNSLVGKSSLSDVPADQRWQVRQSIYRLGKELDKSKLSAELTKELATHRKKLKQSIEYVPFWVVLGVALALGIGTTIGYKRIVVTIAEKIGKTHLTYAQGAAAETVAAVTIGLADVFHAPVSTTQVLSSGIAGTMWANKSGIQLGTIRKILIAWVLTLPMAILLGGLLFFLGVWISGE